MRVATRLHPAEQDALQQARDPARLFTDLCAERKLCQSPVYDFPLRFLVCSTCGATALQRGAGGFFRLRRRRGLYRRRAESIPLKQNLSGANTRSVLSISFIAVELSQKETGIPPSAKSRSPFRVVHTQVRASLR
jgi:hypothetical protein